jgi:hypothetical protein
MARQAGQNPLLKPAGPDIGGALNLLSRRDFIC